MNSTDLNEALSLAIREHSGLEVGRQYLGMSGIGRCPRQTAKSFLGNGRQTPLSDRDHQTSERGYLIESRVKHLLRLQGKLRVDPAVECFENFRYITGGEKELIADFDPRFRGHTDGETQDGDLLEIKSMTSEKYGDARMRGRILGMHNSQVQCYMRYGHYDRAMVIYIDSSTFDHWTYFVALNPFKGNDIEDRAKRILAAIDAGDPMQVQCECGKCKLTYPERQERVITAR